MAEPPQRHAADSTGPPHRAGAHSVDDAATAVELATWLAVVRDLLGEYPQATAALVRHLDHVSAGDRQQLVAAARLLGRTLDRVTQDTEPARQRPAPDAAAHADPPGAPCPACVSAASGEGGQHG